MATQTFTFEMFTGEDVSFPVTIYQSDGTTPQNISGWALRFVLHPPSGPPVVTLTTAGGEIALTTPLSGLATVTLGAGKTALLPSGDYVCYVERADSGFDAILADGTATLKAR